VGRDPCPAADALVGLCIFFTDKHPGDRARRSSGEPPHHNYADLGKLVAFRTSACLVSTLAFSNNPPHHLFENQFLLPNFVSHAQCNFNVFIRSMTYALRPE